MKRIILTLLVCLYSSAVWAQSVVGSGVVRGRVVDQQGVGMPDAELNLDNPALGVTRIVRSSDDGVFEISGLPPAAGYRLRSSHARYHDWNSKEFEVLAGKESSFDVSMRAEEETPTSAADAQAPRVLESTIAPVGLAVSQRQVLMLPYQQRRLDSLILLSPLTTPNPELRAPVLRGVSNGNAYFTDGLLTINSYSNRGSIPAGPSNIDAVQGVEVLAGSAPVEFGHSLGGAVNVVTRSGGNQIHGGVYGYFSNNSLTAVDRYALGNQLFGKRTQPGFNLGGAIPKTKLFYFTNVEVWDGNGQRLNRIINPLITDPSGMYVDLANCGATTAQCAKAASFIESQMNVLVPRSEHGFSGLARLDYRRSDRNTFNLSVFATHGRGPLGAQSQAVSSDGGLLGGAYSKQDTSYGKFEWVASPGDSATNEMRLGVFQDRIATIPGVSTLSTGKLGINLVGSAIGATNVDPGVMRERRYQFVDNFRLSWGAHTFLVGTDILRTRDWIDMRPNAYGTYDYSSLTAFAQDLSAGGKNYSEYTQSLRYSLRRVPTSEMGLYAQDVWRVTPGLQITAGLRYSKQFLPKPFAWDASYYQTRSIKSPSYNADPRIGLALKANDTTVFRASFGMFHTMASGELVDALLLGNGAYQPSITAYPTIGTAPSFPNYLTSTKAASGIGDLLYQYGKPSNPYSRQVSASIEKYVGHGFTMNLGYMGSSGIKLFAAEEVNLQETTKKVTYAVHDLDGAKTDTYQTFFWRYRLDNTRAHVYQVSNGGSSWYHAFVAQLSRRMSRGLAFHASYTWSHLIDDVSSPVIVAGLPVGSYGNDFRFDQGNSNLDQRHRAVFDVTWQPRIVKSDTLPVRYLLNGWELSSITTLATGLPATATAVVLGDQFSGVTSAFPYSLTGGGGWQRVPFLPVNSLRTGNQYVVNARVSRLLPFTERITGRLTFEAFNLLNTQYDTSVSTTAYTVSNGIFVPLSTVGMGTAARGYVTGSNARNCQISFRLAF